MSDLRKMTIKVTPDLYERIQALRGQLMHLNRVDMTTTDVMTVCLEKGLTAEERRAQKAAGAS